MINVIITGANRGIGLAFTQAFISQGYQVYALCRQSNPELDATSARVLQNIDVATEQGLSQMKDKLGGVSSIF